MAKDAKAIEQEKTIKSQAKQIFDLLVQIAPKIPQGVKEAYKVSQETEKALKMSDGAASGLSDMASDDNMRRLAVIADRLSDELSTLNRHDENWWVETSGANVFSPDDSTHALMYLQKQRDYFVKMKEACRALKVTAGTVFASSVSDVKGLAKLYMPSIPAIDLTVTKETINTYDVCIGLIDSILKKLEAAIRAMADWNKAVDAHLATINSSDKMAAFKAMQDDKKNNASPSKSR